MFFAALLCTSLLYSTRAWTASPSAVNNRPSLVKFAQTTSLAGSKTPNDDDLLESLFQSKTPSSSAQIDISSIKAESSAASSSTKSSSPQSLFSKLGIDLDLPPMSPQEADELKAAATEKVNELIAAGIDDLEAMRKQLKDDLVKDANERLAASEQRAQEASSQLLSKLDKMAADFLDKTKDSRENTKWAAAADEANSGARNKGLEVGVWGTVGGVSVQMESAANRNEAVLGSLQQGQSASSSAGSSQTDTGKTQSRILIVADNKSSKTDPYAYYMIDPLIKDLKKYIPDIQVDVYSPTASLPLGGLDAQVVLLFLPSLSSPSSVTNALDRLLRKTLSAGQVGRPPSQIVVVSTVGTERTQVMPYSMQNMWQGGKLEQRRRMEEAVIARVRSSETPMDYTIVKLGEMAQSNGKVAGFELRPGDVLDGSIDVNTAVTVTSQAILYQPAARNATLSCVGSLSKLSSDKTEIDQDALDDEFLRLNGPEVYRALVDIPTAKENVQALIEYLREWATKLAASGKGLTTPIRATSVGPKTAYGPWQSMGGVQVLFLPTNTGANYQSRTEEKERPQQGGTSTPRPTARNQEGGLEFVVETRGQDVRVRARRCNYAPGAVLKELSEETLMGRLKDIVSVWEKDRKTKK
jgi:hypothetical protein